MLSMLASQSRYRFVPLHLNVRVPERSIMKLLMSAVVSAVLMVSAPVFAGSHAGGKMDDKKADCSKKENAEKAECKKS